MRIECSNITMGSTRTFVEQQEVRNTLRVWQGRGGMNGGSLGDTPALISVPMGQNNEEERTRWGSAASRSRSTEEAQGAPMDSMDGRLYVIKSLIEKLTGRKIHLLSASALCDETEATIDEVREIPRPDQDTAGSGWGLVYRHQESHRESETAVFAASGIIRTQEGKDIDFSLYLHMSREFQSQENTVLRAGEAAKVDPLVLNFGGSAAELTTTKFAFDLDSDGEKESISFPRSGSGILVLDRNRDGRVNDGSELFGPQTGNGFAELAQYDRDANRWIDENDSIYDSLIVWTRDTEGIDHLSSLKENRIGALYLASVTSPFDLRDTSNKLHGQIARTGIYVAETGDIRTLQQINLTV